MALNAAKLQVLIVAELSAQGFVVTNQYCYVSKLATAIANAVVQHIVTDSELLPTMTDQGIAGSGIIMGKVK